jgi:hypothetical protein
VLASGGTVREFAMMQTIKRKPFLGLLFSAALLALGPLAAAGQAQERSEVPRGTILPIRLSTTISSAKSKAGEVVTGQIMQDVPLHNGQKIKKGSKVQGKIVKVTPAAGGRGAEVSFRFDTLRMGEKTIQLTTNLRAIAGYTTVEDAQIPDGLSSGEGEVYVWMPTKQIGGDMVYGQYGTVTKWNDASEVVGKSTNDGVLVRVSAGEGTECRGPLYGNDAPQALWVFSSDACGVYGLSHVAIGHAGRNEPVGLIVLKSPDAKISLPGGTGMLLRIDEAK